MDVKTGDDSKRHMHLRHMKSKRHRDPSVCCHEAVEASGHSHEKYTGVAHIQPRSSLHDGCQHCRCSWISRWCSMGPWALQHRQSVKDDGLRLVTVMDGKTGDDSKRHMHLRSFGTQMYFVTKQSRRAVIPTRSLEMSHHDGCQHCRRSSI